MTEIIVKVILIMSVLLVFAVPGFLLRKKDLVRPESIYSMSNILLCVCQPLLIIKAFAVNPIAPSKEVLLNFLWVFLISFAAIVLTFFAAKAFFRFDKKTEKTKKDILTGIGAFSNCSFVGIPFIDMFTGGNSRATMYIILFSTAYNIILWTLGSYLITQDKKQISLRKALLNPCSIGIFAGFLLFLIPEINIFNMPKVAELQQIVIYTGNMTAPLSMMIIGARVADLPPKALFCDKSVYVSSFLRLIISPAITFLIILPFKLAGLFADDIYVLLAPVIAMAMPPAASVVALVEKFDGDSQTATAAFGMGTLLSLVSLPFVLMLITL